MTCLLFSSTVLHDHLANSLLEEDGSLKCVSLYKFADAIRRAYLFLLGVQLAVDKDSTLEVLLRAVAEILIFLKNLLKELVDPLEILIVGVVVAEDVVLHQRLSRRHGDAAHHVEKVGSVAQLVQYSAILGRGNSRHGETGVRKQEAARNLHSCVGLVLVLVEMLDMSTLGLDTVRSQVRDGVDSRMTRRTVIALIVVVCKSLPVVVALHGPSVIVVVVVHQIIWS